MMHTLVGIPRTSRLIVFRQTPVFDESLPLLMVISDEEYMKVFNKAGAFKLRAASANLGRRVWEREGWTSSMIAAMRDLDCCPYGFV